MDFAFMDQIIKFHEDDMDIVVQPSVSVRHPKCPRSFPYISRKKNRNSNMTIVDGSQ